MKPTAAELELAWGPLAELVRRDPHIRGYQHLHASGSLSELTAKLAAVDSLRETIRACGGLDGLDSVVVAVVRRAVHCDHNVATSKPLNDLIISLADEASRLFCTKADALDREGLSKIKIEVDEICAES